MNELPSNLAGSRWLTAPETQRLLGLLEAKGAEARFVGGCVRDTLLQPSLDEVDLDVATQLEPQIVMARLCRAGIQVVPTGLAHGTVTARLGGRSFEITTLRRDVATDGRWAKVAFTRDFALDAARRDFTINAMSCDRAGRVFDYFGGRDDLEAGRVRFVGTPTARIREDYLRILRFFRFHARFGRAQPDPAALAACSALRAGLKGLAGERIWGELKRLLVADGALASLTLMAQTGVWQELFGFPPDLELVGRLLIVDPGSTAVTRLAALIRRRLPSDAAAAALALSDRVLKLSRRERDLLLTGAAGSLPEPALDPASYRRLIYTTRSAERARMVQALALALHGGAADEFGIAIAATERWVPPALPISGLDLQNRGLPEGVLVGKVKQLVERAWLDSDFQLDREQCLALLDRLLSEIPHPRLDTPPSPPT